MKKQQKGFTLIELVMVIVILGILAAFAIPKFADLSGDAEEAVCQGGLAAVKSASGIFHAAWLAGGSGTSVTTMEDGVTYTPTSTGYPDVDNMATLANLDGSFTAGTPAGSGDSETITYTVNADVFTYTENTGVAVATTGCGGS